MEQYWSVNLRRMPVNIIENIWRGHRLAEMWYIRKITPQNSLSKTWIQLLGTAFCEMEHRAYLCQQKISGKAET